MGCHSALMLQMRQDAGAPRRSVPCAVMLPPTVSLRAGCVMAMPTAWTKLMSRDVVRPLGWMGQGLLGFACLTGGCTRFPVCRRRPLSSWRGCTLLSAVLVLAGWVQE